MRDNRNKETEKGSTQFINSTNNEGSSKTHRHIGTNHDEIEDDELDDLGYDSPLSADEVELGKPLKKKLRKHVVYNPCCDHSTFDFVIGMFMDNGQQFRDCVQKYEIYNGFNVS